METHTTRNQSTNQQATERTNAITAFAAIILGFGAMIGYVGSNHFTTTAMMEQRQAAEQWRYFQAKNSAATMAEQRGDKEKADHLRQEQESIKQQARELDVTYNRYLLVHEYLANAAGAFALALALVMVGSQLRRRIFFVFVVMLAIAGAEYCYNALALLSFDSLS